MYIGSFREPTTSGRKKGVRNWNWPLTGCFEWELRKTGFCEGGRVDGRVITFDYLYRYAHFDSAVLEFGLYYFKKIALRITEQWIRERVKFKHDNLGEFPSLNA